MTEWLLLLGAVLLTAGTTVFVAAEFSLVALDRPTVQRAIDEGDSRARVVLQSLKQLSTQLSGDGFIVVPFGQGYASMSAPSRELEKLVIGGQLDHGHNPVLTWMASNVAVEQDAAGN